MKKYILFIALSFISLLCSYHNQKENDPEEINYVNILKDCPVVAHYEVINGDSVLVCDFTTMKEKRKIPISSLLNSYEIVALDTCKDILSSPNWGRAAISPHYIGVKAMEEPLRLFDRKTGNYQKEYKLLFSSPDNLYCDLKNKKLPV